MTYKKALRSQKHFLNSKGTIISKHGVYRRKEKYIKHSLLDSKLSDSLYKTNPNIEDVPAIDEKIAKITLQGVGIFRGNQID